ncbi:hypothetical protein FXO38_30845 [Capsicum annuum]|nr:hypothetical protein FXO38_30845 [Capsicum annuum]
MARVQIDSEELPEQSQSRKNEVEGSKNSFSPIGCELIAKSQHDSIKTICIDRFECSSRGVAGGVVDDGGRHPNVVTAVSHDYEHVGAQEKKICLETPLAQELKFKRGVIPSKKVRESYTPTIEVKRKRRNISQILSILKTEKIATPPNPRVIEVQGPLKKVDIYAALGEEEKKKLEKIMIDEMKPPQEYTMHLFATQDFMSMTNMRERIKDLNFYNNFKSRYDTLRRQSSPGGGGFYQFVSTFKWDEDMINYVKGKR